MAGPGREKRKHESPGLAEERGTVSRVPLSPELRVRTEAGGWDNAWIALGVKWFSTLQAQQPPGSKRQLTGRGLTGFLWLQAPPQLTQAAWAQARRPLVDWSLTIHLSTWARRMLAISEDVKCSFVAQSVESIRHEESMILPNVYGWLSLKYPFWSPLKDEIPCYFCRFSCLISPHCGGT